MATSPTAPSTPRLSEVARYVVVPEGIVTTAWPRVVAKCAELGIEFDPWQHGIGSIALGKRADGLYAATVGGVVLSIPRQVGKTFLVGMIVIALCLLFPGSTWLWTAHHNRATTKTFLTLKGMTERGKIKPFMLDPRMSNGEQELRFRNGSKIMFGAREQGFGRGFDEVDGEVFDEAQILTAKALEDMVPATNQSRHEAGPLLFLMGTPPRPSDPGEEFTARRKAAIHGESEDMVYVEFSADRDADPNDRKQWARANPSYPHRTPLASIKRMRANLTDDASFLREGLGVWDDDDPNKPITPAMWDAAYDREATWTGTPVVAVDVSPYRTHAAICMAATSRSRTLLEVTTRGDNVDHRRGTDWVVPRLIEIARANECIVAVARDTGAAFVPELEAAGVQVEVVGLLGPACAALQDAASDGRLAHLGQAPLNVAVANAVRREVSDGGWIWSRRKSEIDITPLVAATVAHWVHVQQTEADPGVWFA